MTGVQVEEVTAGYRRREPVLREVSLEARAGRVTAVLGANGSGKTTLFRILLGFVLPISGSVRILGRSPRNHRRLHGVGYLPETVALPSGWSGWALLRETVRLSRAADPGGELATAVERTGLGAAALRRSGEAWSGGMARRVALAGVLAGDPGVLLLDEPFTALDVPSRVRVREEVRAAAARGAVVILTSHDLGEVERIADRVVVFRGGRVEGMLEGAALDGAEVERLLLG